MADTKESVQSKRRWCVQRPDEKTQKTLSQELDISPIISQVLINRGVKDLDAAHRFLSPKLSHIHSPLLMKNMEKASDRIIEAVFSNEKITIYGDYDVDGTTATAILMNFLHGIDADVSYYIPDRLSEGYGINHQAVKKIKEMEGKLIITVDCGISDIQEIRFAQENGIDVIVTDHHEVPDELPPAFAIINPKQNGCDFPFKFLAGVGVSFYLVIAVRTKLREMGFWKHKRVPNLKEYLDLVAMGTIADMVPLTDENRIFVKFGLEQLTHCKRFGIAALKEVSGLRDTVITPGMVGFRLAPRINAAGRLSDAGDCVKLLITKDIQEAERIAKALDSANTNRQLIEDRIVQEAKEIVENNEEIRKDRKIILASPHWHPGVIGIAASRLVEEFYKPTVMISLDKGKGKGSARSIEGFHLYEGLRNCAYLLEGFGGHKYAAGLTIKEENIPEFEYVFGEVVKACLSEEDFTPKIYIDGQMALRDMTGKFLDDLNTLSPFGPKNPEPTFSTSVLTVLSSNVVGNGHLKLKVKEDGILCDAIGFSMGDRLPSQKSCVRAAFCPQINEWQGTKTIQMRLKDIELVK